MSLPKNSVPGKSNHSEVAGHKPCVAGYAVLTGAGRSAIAVIELSGTGSHTVIARCFRRQTKRAWHDNEIRYGQWTGPDQENSSRPVEDSQDTAPTFESVVVIRLDSERWEIHCHGGVAAIERISRDLDACGASAAHPSPWPADHDATDDHETAGPFPILMDEACQTLQRCLTQRTAAIALDQVRGALQKWVVDWIARLVSADSPTPASRRLQEEAGRLLKRSQLTARLATPLKVVLVGPPNVGKSSLMNAIVGFERSITFDQAGTTRDVLHADTVLDGLPIQLSDTAGLRASDESIERIGVQLAQQAASEADLVLQICEPEMPNAVESASGETQPSSWDTKRGDAAIIRVLNKADLLPANPPPRRYDVYSSAVTGTGVDELQRQIVQQFATLLPAPGEPALLNRRQQKWMERMVAETKAADDIDIQTVIDILQSLGRGET